LTAYEGELFSFLKRRDAHVHGRKGKLESLAVRRYLHELMADVGEHLNSLSTALSMFIEVGWSPNLHARGVGNLNYLKCRYSDYPFRTAARGEQFSKSLNDRDIFLRRHCDNTTILVPKCRHRSGRCCQRVLVYIHGI